MSLVPPPANGSRVVQRVPPPLVGKVAESRWDPASQAFQVCVEYTQEDGTPGKRWFGAAEVEAKES